MYCKIKCNDLIHSRENILNYNCYKACVKDSILKEKISNLMNSYSLTFGENKNIWIPKEKDKCDYKPDDLGSNSSWVPCKVKTVKNNPNDPEQKILNIKYKLGKLEKEVSILYPSIVIKTCGESIKSRKDCLN